MCPIWSICSVCSILSACSICSICSTVCVQYILYVQYCMLNILIFTFTWANRIGSCILSHQFPNGARCYYYRRHGYSWTLLNDADFTRRYWMVWGVNGRYCIPGRPLRRKSCWCPAPPPPSAGLLGQRQQYKTWKARSRCRLRPPPCLRTKPTPTSASHSITQPEQENIEHSLQ